MTKYLLAHDLGTSGNKATLLSQEGKLAGSCVLNYGTDYFNANWAEQDSGDWWKAVCETSKALLEKTGISNEDIACVSFSGQMMGCLCVDREGTPLRKSIIWADQRAEKQVYELGRKVPVKDFFYITGHGNRSSYGLQKLMWIRDNEPEIYENTYKVLNAKDYIVFKLTGNLYTEYTDASGNDCLDINRLVWSERIIEAAGIDYDKLPEVKESTFIAGGITAEAARATGLKEGTPVVMGGGDGLCANIGAGSYKTGKTYSYIGSSAWIATTTEKPVPDEKMRIVTWPHIVPGLYTPNGSMQSAGGSYHWLKETLCGLEIEKAIREDRSPYEIIEESIEKSVPGARGITFLPYLIGERAPIWDANAKGAFIGLKMENKTEDMYRAVMEGVTYNMSLILDALQEQVTINEITVIGGGAKSEVWRQMMADIYKVKINVPALLEEATSIGAAVTGGVGIGLFKDFSVVDDFLEINNEAFPQEETMPAYEEGKRRFNIYYEALKDCFYLS